MIAEERGRVAGYEELAKIHAAYIGFLLKKLGVTKDNPITITMKDIDEAMALEVRGCTTEEGFKLYIEE